MTDVDELGERVAEAECPVCGEKNWTSPVLTVIQRGQYDAERTPRALMADPIRGLGALMFACQTCGFLRFHGTHWIHTSDGTAGDG